MGPHGLKVRKNKEIDKTTNKNKQQEASKRTARLFRGMEQGAYPMLYEGFHLGKGTDPPKGPFFGGINRDPPKGFLKGFLSFLEVVLE